MKTNDKIVFIGLTEMEKYCGMEENLSGGGSYIEEHGFGHELFNFREDNGYCYGYTPPWGKLNLRNISNVINSDALGDYVDDVLVVFTGTRQGRMVVGWYKHARVYAESVNDERQSRYFDTVQKYIGYNIVCSASDATLIDYDDRSFIIPRATQENKVGHGQHNVWYASEAKDQAFKDSVIAYIDSYDKATEQNSERKYHLHDESNRHISTSTQIARSQKARRECIEIHGCFCNLCGFDFEKAYGNLGKNYIEVHHITPIGELSSAEGYEGTDPRKDLIPLCSNCHAMFHRRRIPYTQDEIRSVMNTTYLKVNNT